MRIAVIGAGPGGLVTLYTIQQRLAKLQNLEVIAFEQGEVPGGEWVLLDKGESGDSSIYQGLHVVFPRPLIQIHPDFPWPDNVASFPSREETLAYFQQFAEKFNLTKYIQFSTKVTMVKKSEQTGFIVETKNLKTNLTTSKQFDYIFFCCGQHRQPFIPSATYTGLANFTGKSMHYNELYEPEKYFGKRILVLGSSFAALDMTVFFARTAKKYYLSWHEHKPFWNVDPKYVDLRPRTVDAKGSTVFFSDGTSAEIDIIIYASGFRQYHPLSSDLDLDFNKSSFLFPTYKTVIHPAYSHLFFIGKAYLLVVQMLRIQAELGCSVIEGKVQLPNKEEMMADMESLEKYWNAENIKFYSEAGDITKYFPTIEEEFEMSNSIAKIAGCSPIKPGLKLLFYKLSEIMKSDSMNYQQYKLIGNPSNDEDFCFSNEE